MEGVKKPKVTKTEMKFYDESEAKKVIESLYKESAMWRLFILTAILGGLRRGEILALEWCNINFEEGFISVNKSISLTVNGQAIIKEPKTKGSKRNITMPEWYFKELKEYWTEWKKGKIESRGTMERRKFSICISCWLWKTDISYTAFKMVEGVL
ncbi:site-specific integrase [Paenibacillus larvae]|uniref:site-specific integrase n=1 Tax=Paenibacillus larvae TaxID=1464 RepID=UPI0022807BA2|nr:site-specific integrase [Paenibacillus larvae]